MTAPFEVDYAARHLGPISRRLYVPEFESPTQEGLAILTQLEADRAFLYQCIAAVYDASAWSGYRHLHGEVDKADLPIGAVVANPNTGAIYQGISQDQELDDPKAHAENQARRTALAAGENLSECTLVVSAEPCPSCIDDIEEGGMARVAYVLGRQSLEQLGQVKTHDTYAPEIIQLGKQQGKYNFDFLQIGDGAIRDAFYEIFTAFMRDPYSEKVSFTGHEMIGSSRFNNYLRQVDDLLDPTHDEQHLPWFRGTNLQAIELGFSTILDSLWRPGTV